MKLLGCIIIIFLSIYTVKGQTDYFDIPTIVALIEHNKQNFSDHQDLKDKQLVSQVSISEMKRKTNEMKRQVNIIDKRLQSIYIVFEDIATAYNVSLSIKTVLSNQAKAIKLAIKYPWLVLWAFNTEAMIISDAKDITGFLYLMIISYGDINKMTVSSRKLIYTELNHQLSKIAQDSEFLVTKLKMIDVMETFKLTTLWQGINNDKKLANEILKTIKF